MVRSRFDDFILFGSVAEGGRFYVSSPADGHNVWVAYDVGAGGRLGRPRVVFGGRAGAGWRGPGLPETGEEAR